jgi:hypothetical protein
MKPSTAFFAVIVAFLITMAGCATSRPYGGHEGVPIVENVAYTHVNSVSNPRDSHWETFHVLTIKNPLDVSVSFDVNCHQEQQSEKTSWIEVNVPPHTAQDVLVPADEGTCVVKRVPARS